MSGEKRAALLAEVARLKERGGSASEDLEGGDGEGDSSMSQQPCRGTVSINSVQLPLKVEFVCSARTQTGTYHPIGYACCHLYNVKFILNLPAAEVSCLPLHLG